MQFVPSYAHPDEMQIAWKLYSRQIDERNVFGRIYQEIIHDWRVKQDRLGDTPERKIILAK